MTLFALSDATAAIIVSSVTALLGTMFGGWMTYLMAKLKQQSETVAAKVEEVHKATNGLTAALGAAKHELGLAQGTALGLQQGRDESKIGDAKAADMLVRDPAGKTIATITPESSINETLVRPTVPPARKPGLFSDESGIVPKK